jgi:hypothetical protein
MTVTRSSAFAMANPVTRPLQLDNLGTISSSIMSVIKRTTDWNDLLWIQVLHKYNQLLLNSLGQGG